MNQQPDKFFREKLEGFQKTAPAPAWEKIEAGLDRKNNKFPWLQIAAAVLVLAVAAFLLWPEQQDEIRVQQQVAEKKTQPPVVKPSPDQELVNKEESVEKTEPVAINKPKRKIRKAEVIQQEDTRVTDDQTENSEIEGSNPENSEGVEYIAQNETTPVVETVLTETASVSREEETITLIYSVEEVNEKFLDKVALDKATSDQKKPSTFRKLLNKAYGLKNNQDPFGELRQKKNEILALNFKSEKRSQNK